LKESFENEGALKGNSYNAEQVPKAKKITDSICPLEKENSKKNYILN